MQTIVKFLHRIGRGMATFYVVATALFALSATPVFAAVFYSNTPALMGDTGGDFGFTNTATSTLVSAQFYLSQTGALSPTESIVYTLNLAGFVPTNCVSTSQTVEELGIPTGNYTNAVLVTLNFTGSQCAINGETPYLLDSNNGAQTMSGRGVDSDDVYLILWNTMAPSSNSTRIVSQNTPINGSLEPDTMVTFDFDFYNNDVEEPLYTTVGYELQNFTNPSQFSYGEDIISSGGSSFSHDQVLSAGSFRMWRPFLFSSSTGQFLYGDWYSFDVVYRSASSTPYIDQTTASSTRTYLQTFCNGFGSSTDAIYTAEGFQYSVCYTLGFMFVPSNASVQQFSTIPNSLQSKFPFAYFYQIKSLFDNGSSTANMFGTMQVNMPLVGTTTILSSQTINYFIGDSTASAIKQLTTFALWLAFAYAVYRQSLRLLKGKH